MGISLARIDPRYPLNPLHLFGDPRVERVAHNALGVGNACGAMPDVLPAAWGQAAPPRLAQAQEEPRFHLSNLRGGGHGELRK